MNLKNFFDKIILLLINFLTRRTKLTPSKINNPKRILVVRQHNQFGDLLASISLFRAIKQTFPKAELTVILSPDNYYGVESSNFIDKSFVFNKKKIFNSNYLISFIKLLRVRYDLAIVPATVSISSTSCMMAGFSNSKRTIGPNSLEGKFNKYNFLFNYRIDLNWGNNPERHVADFGLDIVRPLGITTSDWHSQIDYDEGNIEDASEFIDSLEPTNNELIVGLHIGAGKPPNRWPIENFVELSEKLNSEFSIKLFLTGSSFDLELLNKFKKTISFNVGLLLDRTIPMLAATINSANLFITNDTGVMHVAGATRVNQISLFGPTNPNNWAPIGENKINVKKGDDINLITVNEIFRLSKKYLS